MPCFLFAFSVSDGYFVLFYVLSSIEEENSGEAYDIEEVQANKKM